MMAAATLCVIAGASMSIRLQARADATAMPRGERLDRMVVARGVQRGEGPDVALAEIIASWRSDLATRMGEGDSGTEPRRETINRQGE
jgi:hypothetical protein